MSEKTMTLQNLLSSLPATSAGVPDFVSTDMGRMSLVELDAYMTLGIRGAICYVERKYTYPMTTLTSWIDKSEDTWSMGHINGCEYYIVHIVASDGEAIMYNKFVRKHENSIVLRPLLLKIVGGKWIWSKNIQDQ